MEEVNKVRALSPTGNHDKTRIQVGCWLPLILIIQNFLFGTRHCVDGAIMNSLIGMPQNLILEALRRAINQFLLLLRFPNTLGVNGKTRKQEGTLRDIP